jgi:hypothetical protein
MLALPKWILMFIGRATLKQTPITDASQIILSSWKLSGMSVIIDALAFGQKDEVRPLK